MTVGGKATEELAKLGQKSLETADKAGGWVDRVFGGGFIQLGAAFEDSMAGFRIRNRAKVLEKTKQSIEKSGLSGRLRSLDPRIAVPIIDAISDESDDTLQGVWSSFILGAVDPERPDPDRILIGVIKGLEPFDWQVLQAVFRKSHGKMSNVDFGVDTKDLVASLDRLTHLGLFSIDDSGVVYWVSSRSDVGKRKLTIMVDDIEYTSTRLLKRLAQATGKDPSDDA